jgi:hypothetical protein
MQRTLVLGAEDHVPQRHLLNDITCGIDSDVKAIEMTINDSDGELLAEDDILVLTSIQEMLLVLKGHVGKAITRMRR